MYQIESSLTPFWGEDRLTKGGRDPLAVQNSSVIIYADMVSGITNLTSHIRYNAFYCWLLTLIAKNVGTEHIDSHKLQFKYLRRGELLYAYMMHFHYPDVTGSAGSTYAYNNDKAQVLDLAKGADIENKSTPECVYWKNPLGVFGQYYMGAMMQLRLVCPPDSTHATYRPTAEGVRLHEIYSRSIDAQCESVFWNAIKSGTIDVQTLVELKSMALNNIHSEVELAEYVRILSSSDAYGGEDTFNRFNTIKLLLKYVNRGHVQSKNFVLPFLKDNFQRCIDANCVASHEELAWLLYEMNELAHSAYEAFHFSILYMLGDDNPLPVEYVFKQLKEDYDSYASNGVSAGASLYDLYDNLETHFKQRNFGGYLYDSLGLMIQLKTLCDKYHEELAKTAQKGGYQVHQGFVLELLQRLLGSAPYQNNWETVESVLYSAINDHLSSSYAKSDIGQGLVHNYMLDEGVLWPLRFPVPVRTSPRLQNVIQYIRDIELIKREGEIFAVTEFGNKFLAL
jgi:hypothetical protein